MLGKQRAMMYKCVHLFRVQGKLLTPTHIGDTTWRYFPNYLVEGSAF